MELTTEAGQAAVAEHFCTYFDHRYLPKGVAMWRSLKAHSTAAVLHVLCLTDACRAILEGLQLCDVHLYSLDDIEGRYRALLEARTNRSLVEYYFTLTPCFPLYLLETRKDIGRLTYVDADLFFFSNPKAIFEELGERAIALIEHRFPARLEHLHVHGRFNVGWLTFVSDAAALACLRTWRDQCLEWCHDRLDDDRFAEQKYLDAWPDVTDRVTIVRHRGANVAPWNLDRFELSVDEGRLCIGGDPVLFYHAHGFELRGTGAGYDSHLAAYGVSSTWLMRQWILEPYERALRATTMEVSGPLALALLADRPREAVARLTELESRLSRVDAQLACCETDRAARLDAIQSLGSRLDASEADRAARLALIQALQARLVATEAEGAARLVELRVLETRLHACEHSRAAEVAQVRDQLEALLQSRTWRWSEPLRLIAAHVRAGSRRAR